MISRGAANHHTLPYGALHVLLSSAELARCLRAAVAADRAYDSIYELVRYSQQNVHQQPRALVQVN